MGSQNQFQIEVLGPIAFDLPLDSELVYFEGFERYQSRLLAALNGVSRELAEEEPPAGAAPWTVAAIEEQDLLYTPPGGRNRDVLPMALVRYEDPLVSALVDGDLKAVAGENWSLRALSVNFFTFSVACVRLSMTVTLPPSLDSHAFAILTEQITTRLSTQLWRRLERVVQAFEQGARLAIPLSLDDGSGSTTSKDDGLLWLQRVFITESDDPAAARDHYRGMLPNFYEVLEFRDSVVVIGVDNSVIACNAVAEEPDWIIRIFEFEAAMLARALAIDGALFHELNALVVTSRGANRRQSLKHVRFATRSFEGSELFRSKVQSTVAFLGSASVGVWQSRTRVSGWGQLEASTERKLTLLSRMAQQRYSEAEAHRTDRFNRLALMFTLFTVLSSGAALADFVVGGAILGVNETRLMLLTTMTAVFSVLVLATSLTARPLRVWRRKQSE